MSQQLPLPVATLARGPQPTHSLLCLLPSFLISLFSNQAPVCRSAGHLPASWQCGWSCTPIFTNCPLLCGSYVPAIFSATSCLKLLRLPLLHALGVCIPHTYRVEHVDRGTVDPHTVGSQCAVPTAQGRILAYRLKVLVGSAGVCSEPIGVKDALRVVLVASQVVTSHKVPGSWGNEAGRRSVQPTGVRL